MNFCTLNWFYRKISAATFEDGCQSPILKQETDGSMSFLTIPPISYGQTNNLQMERRDSVAPGQNQSGERTPKVYTIKQVLSSQEKVTATSWPLASAVCLICMTTSPRT